jgi:hypothetical protein
MSALHAETPRSERHWARVRNTPRPSCSICSDTMIAPEASVFNTNGQVSYLWSCDACGHSFVTEITLLATNAG